MEIGVHSKVIQERLGHADATLTMDTYAHVLHTLQSDTATQFEQLLNAKNRSTERLMTFWQKNKKVETEWELTPTHLSQMA